MAKLKNIAEYISASPKEAQKHLREMRAILKKAAPKANEDINLKGNYIQSYPSFL